jgi:hypothetical protein
MKKITRQLLQEEFTAWDELVASSPQASLFHTTSWNQMLFETASERQEWLPLVCENNGALAGGISLHCKASGSIKQSVFPQFGYNGPILSNDIKYSEPYKTVPGYEIILEILKSVDSFPFHVVIKNQPELWDMRAYTYKGWKVETNYTHILPFTSRTDVWQKINSEIKEEIFANNYFVNIDFSDKQIQKFSLLAVKASASGLVFSKTETKIMEKRIAWMKERGLCQLVVVTDKAGKEIAIALFILSSVNHTIYLSKIILLGKQSECDVLPSLVWQVYLTFGGGFDFIDLNYSNEVAVSTLKDKMGATLTPSFISKQPKKRQ